MQMRITRCLAALPKREFRQEIPGQWSPDDTLANGPQIQKFLPGFRTGGTDN
jgi:hypothetical protein